MGQKSKYNSLPGHSELTTGTFILGPGGSPPGTSHRRSQTQRNEPHAEWNPALSRAKLMSFKKTLCWAPWKRRQEPFKRPLVLCLHIFRFRWLGRGGQLEPALHASQWWRRTREKEGMCTAWVGARTRGATYILLEWTVACASVKRTRSSGAALN